MTASLLANFDWVISNLATGGDLPFIEEDAQQHIKDWVQSGVTHVIDMRMEHSDEDLVELYAPQIKYLHNQSDDAYGYRMPQDVLDAGVQFARQAEREGGKVLAHCHMGINRGPSMAFAILLDRGWDPVAAFDRIKRRRPQSYIAYALDALRSDHRRQGKRLTAEEKQDRYRRLSQHIKKVNNVHEAQRINGIIRGIRTEEGGTVYR